MGARRTAFDLFCRASRGVIPAGPGAARRHRYGEQQSELHHRQREGGRGEAAA
jgi:hypothetical protein